MQISRLAAMAAVSIGFTATAQAQAQAQDRREAGAHQHGRGTLNIAIDGDTAAFDMRVPGADIIGFEHGASTQLEKSKLAAAKAILGDPLKVVAPPDAAGCVASQAFVHYTKDPEHAAHHAEKHGGEHHKGDHDGHHNEHAGHQEGHAEFHLGFQFKCLAPEKLTTFSLNYFDHFENAQSLEVTIAADKGQSQLEATREKRTLDLSAVM